MMCSWRWILGHLTFLLCFWVRICPWNVKMALLSLQKLWFTDTALWLCPSQFMTKTRTRWKFINLINTPSNIACFTTGCDWRWCVLEGEYSVTLLSCCDFRWEFVHETLKWLCSLFERRGLWTLPCGWSFTLKWLSSLFNRCGLWTLPCGQSFTLKWLSSRFNSCGLWTHLVDGPSP